MDKAGLIRHISAAASVFVLLTALAGCRKADVPGSKSTAQAQLSVSLDIDGVDVNDSKDTKSVVGGSTLNENDRNYGIIACEHEDTPTNFVTYDADNANIYGNIKGWYGNYNSKGTAWWYSFEPTESARFNPLFFVTEDTSRHMDLYAYAPWKPGVTIDDGYLYNLNSTESNLEDVMYATYDDVGGNPTNRDLTIVNNSTIPLSVHFHHALSRVVFHIRLANAQNTGLDGNHAIRLFQIQLQKASTSATQLYDQGKMNLLNGQVTEYGSSKTEQTVIYATDNNYSYLSQMQTYDIYQSDVWKNFNMLVHPTEYLQDNDFSFKFWFNGTTYNKSLNFTYDIKRSDLLHPDGTTYGFKPGYCYHFYFIIDNYIHLSNVVINKNWELTEETEIKV